MTMTRGSSCSDGMQDIRDGRRGASVYRPLSPFKTWAQYLATRVFVASKGFIE